MKILDLGLARVAEAAADELLREGLTAEGHVMGTRDYIAPEQWDDPRTVGPAADLYSLGCTLFFLLTGKPPFGSDRHSSAARKMVAPPQRRTSRPGGGPIGRSAGAERDLPASRSEASGGLASERGQTREPAGALDRHRAKVRGLAITW